MRIRRIGVLHVDLLLADVDLLALTDSIQTPDLGAMQLLLDISSFIRAVQRLNLGPMTLLIRLIHTGSGRRRALLRRSRVLCFSIDQGGVVSAAVESSIMLLTLFHT